MEKKHPRICCAPLGKPLEPSIDMCGPQPTTHAERCQLRTAGVLREMRAHTCAFCGKRCLDSDSLRVGARVSRKDSLLVLLCASLSSYTIPMADAQKLYGDCRRVRKRVCKRHFVEAAAYIGGMVFELNGAPVERLFTVASPIMEEVLANLETYREALDGAACLTFSQIAQFYCDYNSEYSSHYNRKRKKAVDVDELNALNNSDHIVADSLFMVKKECDDDAPHVVDFTSQRRIPSSLEEILSHLNNDQGHEPGTSGQPLSEFPTCDNESYEAALPNNSLELEETDPSLLERYFLISGKKLLRLFKFCPNCGARLSSTMRSVRLRAEGTAPIVNYVCVSCAPYEKVFEGQEKTVQHPQENSFLGDVQMAVAAITTGTRFTELKRWSKEANISFFSKEFFYSVFSWSIPCIERIYSAHQYLKSREGCDYLSGVNIVTSGPHTDHDGTEHLDKIVLADQLTKLILHTEVIDRSVDNDHSLKVETEGMRNALQSLLNLGYTVSSITMDRNLAFDGVIQEISETQGLPITRFCDGRQIEMYIISELEKASEQPECEAIAGWIPEVRTIFWKSIEEGELGQDVRHRFNTCLMHVIDIHKWEKNSLTGRYTSCFHEVLDTHRPESLQNGSEAPLNVTKAYTMISTLHFNAVSYEELVETSPQEEAPSVRRKSTKSSQPVVAESTSIDNKWRRDILNSVLGSRLTSLQSGSVADELIITNEIREVMKADESLDELNGQLERIRRLKNESVKSCAIGDTKSYEENHESIMAYDLFTNQSL
ncbi:hypothetical protein Q1695_008696 [Nippostrongylus brasiliensis]|nr:hypothetical protein Q1695_008696 [Nippostrongylus brasiliensis]